MKGLEPSTFCMASRRSSQLSYIRVRTELWRRPARLNAGRRHRTPARPPLGAGGWLAVGRWLDELREDLAEVDHRLAEVLRPLVPARAVAVHHLVPVPVALHRLRVIDRDRRGLLVEVVPRVAALDEHVPHDAIRLTRCELRVVHETALRALPISRETLTRVV